MKKLISLDSLIPFKKTVNAVESCFTVHEKKGTGITQLTKHSQTVTFSNGQIVRIK